MLDSPSGALTLDGDDQHRRRAPSTRRPRPSGRYLYVQTGGNGIVDEFRVGSAGSLTEVGSVTVPNAVGGEGIADVLNERDTAVARGGPDPTPAPPPVPGSCPLLNLAASAGSPQPLDPGR